eukprot:CAMPEP_0197535806 /NCGR_PEP_ID=MMETSP1318-20131121/51760_1 /TAXON_ID=552666 /ORGANISM="Partenskyella glossopodia, Strain RCC365" /LENGTH=207 /DNA_ID=CAMNT_0043093495 /DNA_START=437 /DNA_END=1057 /DNA_ORIENTATION=-
MIRSIRGQLFRFLKDARLIQRNIGSPDDPKLNGNSNNVPLLRAIIGVGAYPNVAYGKLPKKKIEFETRDRMKRLKIHPSSVNRTMCNDPSMRTYKYLAFFEVMRSTDVFLHTTSVLSSLSLILLSGPRLAELADDNNNDRKNNIKKKNNNSSAVSGVKIDDFLMWSCSQGLGERLRVLRTLVDATILQSLPGVVYSEAKRPLDSADS